MNRIRPLLLVIHTIGGDLQKIDDWIINYSSGFNSAAKPPKTKHRKRGRVCCRLPWALARRRYPRRYCMILKIKHCGYRRDPCFAYRTFSYQPLYSSCDGGGSGDYDKTIAIIPNKKVIFPKRDLLFSLLNFFFNPVRNWSYDLINSSNNLIRSFNFIRLWF